MSNEIYIGRQTELEYFQDGLERALDASNPSRLFSLKGGKKMGKRSFVTELVRRLLKEPSSHWLVLRGAEGWTAAKDAQAWTGQWNKSIFTNQSSFAEVITPLSEMTFDNISAWWKELKGRIEGKSKSALHCLWILDDYDTWSTEQKKWFAEEVYAGTKNAEAPWDIRFLVSSKSSVLESADLEAHWGLSLNDAVETELHPISEKEVTTFLAEVGIAADKAAELHTRSKGNPEALVRLLKPLMEQEDVRPAGDFEEFLKSKTEQQVAWLRWAAHLGQVSPESLEIYCEQQEAEECYAWLIEQEDIRLKKYSDKRVFDDPVVKPLLESEEKEDRLVFKEAERKASEYQQIVALIPNLEDRKMLAKISICKHFNQELLVELFPDEYESIFKYIRKHKDFFKKTDHNIKMVDDVYATISDYTALLPRLRSTELAEKVEGIWTERRASVIEEMAVIEEGIEVEEKNINEVRAELREILSKVNSHESVLMSAKQKKLQQQQQSRPKPKRDYSNAVRTIQLSIGGLVIVLGIVFLYTGILYQLSYTYSAIGLGFILTGFFWPYKKRVVVAKAAVEKNEDAEEAEARNAAPSDKHLRLLNMELTNLENKRSILSRNIAKQRRAHSGLDTVLSEPYI